MISEYSKQEARTAFRQRHIAVLLGCMAGSVATSYLLPSMPEAVYRFFKKIFAMNNWTEIILINDFTGVFFALFWLGVVDLLRVYVMPSEEGYLGLLLAKPITRSQFLLAKTLPVFAVIGGIGVALSLFLPLKIALINGSADLRFAGVVCAGIVTAALAIALLALLNLVFLFAGETYYAVIFAFIIFTLAVLPAALFMYRPDVFQARPGMRNLFVFPGNLLWFSASLPELTPLILLAATLFTATLLAGGGRRLKSMEITS
jgi:ABC-type transport system involved in multi-copper enzyme maturation permease subunit